MSRQEPEDERWDDAEDGFGDGDDGFDHGYDRFDHGEDRFDHGEDRFDHGDDGFDDGDDGFDDPGDGSDDADDGFVDPDARRWPLHWQNLYPRERWLWFEQLWADVCMLRSRYRLAVRSGWWEDQLQVEALAAFAAWLHLYDCGELDDPQGKLALIYDLERLTAILREGGDPFHPDRDRLAFARYLIDVGCQPPPSRTPGA